MVAVTVMRVLLFVLHVCMLRECEGARVAEIGAGGDVVSVGHVGGTRCSCIVSSAGDVLEMPGCVGWKELVECVKCVCGCTKQSVYHQIHCQQFIAHSIDLISPIVMTKYS